MKALLIDASQGMQIQSFAEFLPELTVCYRLLNKESFDDSLVFEEDYNRKTYLYQGKQINGVYIYSEKETSVTLSLLRKKVIPFIALHTSLMYVESIADTGPAYRIRCVLGNEVNSVEIPKDLFVYNSNIEVEKILQLEFARFVKDVVHRKMEQLASAVNSDINNRLNLVKK